MNQNLFSVLGRLILLFVIPISISCTHGQDANKNGPDNNKDNSTFNLGGSVSKLLLSATIQKAYAGEPLCSSACNVRVNSCASLFEITASGDENWICDTSVDANGQYNFPLRDRGYFKDKNLKVTVNFYKSQQKEVTTNIAGAPNADIKVDIDTETTIESIFKSNVY